jgi:hypothetical protein
MTLFTPNYAWPFPELTDSPNGPTEIENLALAIDTQLAVTDGTVATNASRATLLATLFGTAVPVYYAPTVTVATINSLTFAGFRDTSANLLGVSFVAPPSGKVSISFGAALISSVSTSEVQLTFNVLTGSTVGSGSSIFTGTAQSSVVTKTTTETMPSRHVDVTGLTPNSSFNASFTWKLTAAGTATAAIPWMEIIPLPL